MAEGHHPDMMRLRRQNEELKIRLQVKEEHIYNFISSKIFSLEKL